MRAQLALDTPELAQNALAPARRIASAALKRYEFVGSRIVLFAKLRAQMLYAHPEFFVLVLRSALFGKHRALRLHMHALALKILRAAHRELGAQLLRILYFFNLRGKKLKMGAKLAAQSRNLAHIISGLLELALRLLALIQKSGQAQRVFHHLAALPRRR